MGRPKAVNRTDIDRAIKSAKENGLCIAEIHIEPQSVRLICGLVAEEPKPEDSLVPKPWPKRG